MSAAPRIIPPIGVTVNGEDHVFDHAITIAQLLAKLELPERGIAVAVDGAVFVKSRWGEQIERGWDIEILTAVQGG